MAEDRWPLLSHFLSRHFHNDFETVYGSVFGAIKAATHVEGRQHQQALVEEWRDWNLTQGVTQDIRPFLSDGFCVEVHFETARDARNFMNQIYDYLKSNMNNTS